MLAVLVLPAEHRGRYREEWTAFILDRSRIHQLRYADSFLLGAYFTRRALQEAGAGAPVSDLGENGVPRTGPP
jgi:hypothetical protein